MSDNYPGGWFGESWGAPACDPERHKPTPVGDKCIDCAGEILDTDQGMIIPFAGMRPAVLGAHHLDCFLRTLGIPTTGVPISLDGFLRAVDEPVRVDMRLLDEDERGPHT